MSRLFWTLLLTTLSALLVVPFMYQERGYFAIGGEIFIIIIVGCVTWWFLGGGKCQKQ